MKMTQDNEVKRMKCGIVKFKELGSNSNGVCAFWICEGFLGSDQEEFYQNFTRMSCLVKGGSSY
jgi:hypothetical protein